MSTHPTRILSGDLEDQIRQLLHSLISFQGDHASLLQRLQALTVSDLTGDTEKVVQDLLAGLTDSKGSTIERIRQLEKNALNIEHIQKDIAVEPDIDEYYEYNADGDVTLHQKYKPNSKVAADLLEETAYTYGDLSLTLAQIDAGIQPNPATAKGIVLRRSIKKFKNSKKQKVTITQEYLYDSNQSINGIKTRTKVDTIAPMALERASMTWTPTLNSFKIDWQNPTGLDPFDFDHVVIRLYRADGSLLKDTGPLKGVNTYTFTGLTANTDYRFEIVAVDDSANESTPVSDVFNTGGQTGGTTPPGTGTGQPATLMMASVVNKTKHEMELSWAASPTDVNYHHMQAKVFVYPDEGFSTLLQVVDMPPGIMNGFIKDLQTDMRYKIECYGVNINGTLSANAITILERTTL